MLLGLGVVGVGEFEQQVVGVHEVAHGAKGVEVTRFTTGDDRHEKLHTVVAILDVGNEVPALKGERDACNAVFLVGIDGVATIEVLEKRHKVGLD